MKIAANLSLLFSELPLLHRVQAAVAAGFSGVEVQFPYEQPAMLWHEALQRAGVPLVLFNLPAGDLLQGGRGLAAQPDCREAFAEGLQLALRYAALLRPRAVNVLAGRLVAPLTREVAWQTLVDNLRQTADAFAVLGTGYWLGIPVPIWIMALVFALAWYLLNHTRLGRYIYALGGNEAATRLSGINVDRVKIAVYTLCGALSALAGLIVTSRLSSAQPTAGMGYELDAIAAVVVGGTSLMGGKGRIMGTLIGALIIGFLNNALNLLDVSSYYQMIAKAAVILLAVMVDTKTTTK